MGDRTTSSDAAWQELQWAVMVAGSHVTLSDHPGLIGSSREAAGGSRFLSMRQSDENALVAALAKDQARKRPNDAKDRADIAGEPALGHIRTAAAMVATTAPEDLEAFRDFLTGLAQAVATEIKGVRPPDPRPRPGSVRPSRPATLSTDVRGRAIATLPA